MDKIYDNFEDLIDELIDDLIASPDKETIEEVKECGDDPKIIAKNMRKIINNCMIEVGINKMNTVQKALKIMKELARIYG